MYPRLSDFFRDVLGINLPFEIFSFGAMVAVAILTATWIASRELDRLYANGLIGGVRVPALEEGDQKASKGRAKGRTKGGAKGNARKQGATKVVSPSAIMGAVTLIAVFGGFGGARLFHILENLDKFFAAPFDMIFTKGGFTFYGGLIVAGGGIVYLVRKKGLSVGRFIDALAPTVILAYGIGRIGCHLAGDGDWGIASNLAAKPSWLPTWLWAETYPKNIIYNTPVPESGYVPLPEAVYPTPLYEFAAGILLFAVLWSLRKHTHAPGWLFSLFLVFAGVERFLIEKIRVNNVFDVLGLSVTQAEIISVVLVALGLFGMWRTWKLPAGSSIPTTPSTPATEP